MTDNGLIHRGYHLEKDLSLDVMMEAVAMGVTAIFVKEFYEDEDGKDMKYLIRIRKYRSNPFSYEAVVIWKQKDHPEKMVSTMFCEDWTADEIEAFAEDFYQKMNGMIGVEVTDDEPS